MPTSQFTIYTSSDTSGPGLLTGLSGSLIPILDAVLVNGYGSKAPAGWTKPLPNSASVYACYQPGSGSKFNLFINDNAGQVQNEAYMVGWESITSLCQGTPALNVGAGTGQFPYISQSLTTGRVVLRKSLTVNTVGRPWVIVADAYTAYIWIQTGDPQIASLGYTLFSFGDIFSLRGTADAWRCHILGVYVDNTANPSNNRVSCGEYIAVGPWTGGTLNGMTNAGQPGQWMARNAWGTSNSRGFYKRGDPVVATIVETQTDGSNHSLLNGVLPCPNNGDSAYYLCPLSVVDGGNASPYIRGRMRGLYQFGHAQSNFNDGQLISGSVDYAGKMFQIVSPSIRGGFWAFEVSPTVETN